MTKSIYFFTLSVLFFSLISFDKATASEVAVTIAKANCEANQNLKETCISFIGRCRKGNIKSKFPGQFYNVKIEVVRDGTSAVAKTAWKLLNDSRFKK